MIKNCSYDVNGFVPHFRALCSAINEYKVANSRFISLFPVVVYNDDDGNDNDNNDSSSRSSNNNKINRQHQQIDARMCMGGFDLRLRERERDKMLNLLNRIYTVERSMDDSKLR